jgi:DNA-binding NarL/FixJ family response regulator
MPKKTTPIAEQLVARLHGVDAWPERRSAPIRMFIVGGPHRNHAAAQHMLGQQGRFLLVESARTIDQIAAEADRLGRPAVVVDLDVVAGGHSLVKAIKTLRPDLVVIAMGTSADDLMPVVMDAEPDAYLFKRRAGPPLDQVLRQVTERRTDTERAIA